MARVLRTDLKRKRSDPSDHTAECGQTKPIFLKLTAASCYIPKEDPRRPLAQGDDAHFMWIEKNTIGFADGVGGWSKLGIDAGEYARRLMLNSVLALFMESRNKVNPKRVLRKAYAKTNVQGSSTACIIALTGKKLRAVNVGDSGFLVIRNGEIVYQSQIQQKSFNCPYQLGMNQDDPSVAMEMEVEVDSGDLILAGTDGLLDNMSVDEILEAMKLYNNSEVARSGVLEEHARRVANLALYNSLDKFKDTPYSKAARAHGRTHKGGKIDDITVIVARIE